MFQHTAARRRLGVGDSENNIRYTVSTHSRPKAAGSLHILGLINYKLCFNTQPPEGGWVFRPFQPNMHILFQHTAARRRLASIFVLCIFAYMFQHTAARRRLGFGMEKEDLGVVFQHTAARRRLEGRNAQHYKGNRFQHTAARRRLDKASNETERLNQFQHTAARRRLEPFLKALLHQVSQPRFR